MTGPAIVLAVSKSEHLPGVDVVMNGVPCLHLRSMRRVLELMESFDRVGIDVLLVRGESPWTAAAERSGAAESKAAA